MKYKDFPKLLRHPLLNYGLSGKFGNWVFRQQNGRTVFYARYQGPVSNTPKQQKSRSKFRDAVHYANQAMLVPEIKAEYAVIAKKKKKKNVHLLATQYFLKGIHIPLPVPPRVTKYASWEEILKEIYQMQPLVPRKPRKRSRISKVSKPITSSLPRKLSGVGLRTLKQFESGKGNPTLLTLQKLADVLGMEVCLKVKNITSAK